MSNSSIKNRLLEIVNQIPYAPYRYKSWDTVDIELKMEALIILLERTLKDGEIK